MDNKAEYELPEHLESKIVNLLPAETVAAMWTLRDSLKQQPRKRKRTTKKAQSAATAPCAGCAGDGAIHNHR